MGVGAHFKEVAREHIKAVGDLFKNSSESCAMTVGVQEWSVVESPGSGLLWDAEPFMACFNFMRSSVDISVNH